MGGKFENSQDPMESVKKRYEDGLKQTKIFDQADIRGMMNKTDEEWASIQKAQQRQDELKAQETMAKYEGGKPRLRIVESASVRPVLRTSAARESMLGNPDVTPVYPDNWSMEDTSEKRFSAANRKPSYSTIDVTKDETGKGTVPGYEAPVKTGKVQGY